MERYFEANFKILGIIGIFVDDVEARTCMIRMDFRIIKAQLSPNLAKKRLMHIVMSYIIGKVF